jgi:hypothetical protein
MRQKIEAPEPKIDASEPMDVDEKKEKKSTNLILKKME